MKILSRFKPVRWLLSSGAIAVALASGAALTPSGASAQNATNADAVYNGWLKAYLVRSGGKTYFTDGLNPEHRSMAFMWGQAWDISVVEDAYERNHAEDRKQLVSDLLNTFIQQNGTDLTWDSWNDDIAWAVIALVRGYQITGDTKFLDAAAKSWNATYNRGWDNIGGGGIWEEMDSKYSKCSLSNHPMVIAGVPLYEATHDVSYLNKSEAIYAWTRSKLFHANGAHDECVAFPKGAPSFVQVSDNAYNSGLQVNAATQLYRVTGKRNYYDDAKLGADHVIGKYDIMTEDHPANGSFGAEQFVRGLSSFARQNGLWSQYYPWLQANCQAAWNVRRKDYNISQNNWKVQTPASGELWTMEAVSSVVVQAVTQFDQAPATGIAGTHMIVSAQNGIAIDNGNTNAQGAGVILWAKNGGPQQKWTFTQNSDTSWTITNQLSGLVLDDPAFSKTNGQKLDQWGSNGGDNQRWWVDKQSDGTYKIWNKSSSAALDTSSSSTNGQALIQWSWNGGSQQRWLLQ